MIDVCFIVLKLVFLLRVHIQILFFITDNNIPIFGVAFDVCYILVSENQNLKLVTYQNIPFIIFISIYFWYRMYIEWMYINIETNFWMRLGLFIPENYEIMHSHDAKFLLSRIIRKIWTPFKNSCVNQYSDQLKWIMVTRHNLFLPL